MRLGLVFAALVVAASANAAPATEDKPAVQADKPVAPVVPANKPNDAPPADKKPAAAHNPQPAAAAAPPADKPKPADKAAAADKPKDAEPKPEPVALVPAADAPSKNRLTAAEWDLDAEEAPQKPVFPPLQWSTSFPDEIHASTDLALSWTGGNANLGFEVYYIPRWPRQRVYKLVPITSTSKNSFTWAVPAINEYPAGTTFIVGIKDGSGGPGGAWYDLTAPLSFVDPSAPDEVEEEAGEPEPAQPTPEPVDDDNKDPELYA